MIDDLEKLLAKADAPAPPAQADLAGVVRGIVDARRRRRRFAVASTALLLLAAGVGVAVVMPRPHPESHVARAPAIDVQAIRHEIAELDAEAARHSRTAAAMQKAIADVDQLYAARETLSKLDGLTQVDGQYQAAAQLMLTHADRLELNPKRRADAAESYRTLVSLFPNTLAGREATRRLNAGV